MSYVKNKGISFSYSKLFLYSYYLSRIVQVTISDEVRGGKILYDDPIKVYRN